MKECKLILDGKEITCQISDEELERLTKKKKTGYERVDKNGKYFYMDCSGDIDYLYDKRENIDETQYEVANYYSDKPLAENDARFYELHRKLKRFAVENRKDKLDWDKLIQNKYYIFYDVFEESLNIGLTNTRRLFDTIYFDSKETAEKAIETFKDELIWYFTEFRDSL